MAKKSSLIAGWWSKTHNHFISYFRWIRLTYIFGRLSPIIIEMSLCENVFNYIQPHRRLIDVFSLSAVSTGIKVNDTSRRHTQLQFNRAPSIWTYIVITVCVCVSQHTHSVGKRIKTSYQMQWCCPLIYRFGYAASSSSLTGSTITSTLLIISGQSSLASFSASFAKQ